MRCSDFCPIFITKLITELSAHRLFYSRSKSLPSRCCSVLLFTFVNSVNMLSCLSGDSFSNQRKKTGTHLYSSSRAGKHSAVWLGATFPSLWWVRTCSSFRWAWSSTSTWTNATKQTMETELLTKRLEYWRPNASLTSPSLSLRVACVQTSPPPSAKRLLKSVSIWNKGISLNLKQLEGC